MIVFYFIDSIIAIIAMAFIYVFVDVSLAEVTPKQLATVKTWILIAFAFLVVSLVHLGWTLRQDLLGFFPV